MSRAVQNLAGQRFGELTAKHLVPFTGKGARWFCECSCGKSKVVSASNLKRGYVKSCGHIRKAPKSLLTKEQQRARDIERATRWNKQNAERRKEICRQHRKANLSKHAAKSAAYRFRKVAQTCRCCSKEDFALVYLLASLGNPALTVDHIVPLSKGGSHCVSNMQLLTFSENASKGARVTGGY